MLASSLNLFAQDTDSIPSLPITPKLHFLEPAPQPHKGRIIGVSTFGGVSYTAGMIAVNQLWYSQYERTHFHFFDDNGEWNQIDKVGHAWTSYAEGYYGISLYRWAGLHDKKSIWIGGMLGTFFQSGIEVLDGFSAKWGASVGDLVANVSGSAMVIAQELAWQEQRIWFKLSSHKVNYNDYPLDVQTRAKDLFGTSFQELLLKDYNGQSYWLSVNPSAFSRRKNGKFPKWLNVAIGYGIEDVFGGFENKWTTDDGTDYDFSELQRYRQFYLSLDIDLSRIKTKSRFLNFVLAGFNVLKIPAPALEWNTKGQVKFHPLYW